MYAAGAVLIRAGKYLDLVRYHERRVESQSEMSDYGLILILGHELLGTRECDLVDILVHLVGRHAYAAVGYRQRPLVGIHAYADRQIAHVALGLALGRERFELLRRIDGVRYQLSQEDLVVGIQKFLDYGEDVFCRYPYFPVFHVICLLVCLFAVTLWTRTNRVPPA